MKILVVKTPSGLKPCYNSDYEVYSKIPLEETFEIDYKKSRNIKFHKKYFALLKLAFENQSEYKTLNDMRRDLIISGGFYKDVVNRITGEVYPLVDSISFASMDEIKFNEVYDKTKNVISEWLGITNQKIDDEIEQYF